MAGGNAHQRAVERTKVSRIEREVLDAVSRVLGGSVVVAARNIPWYESARFWGGLSACISIILTVVAASLRDVRWLVFVAWPFAVLCLSVICKPLRTSRWHWRRLLLGLLAVMTVSGLTIFGFELPGRALPGVEEQPQAASERATPPLTESDVEDAVRRALRDQSQTSSPSSPAHAASTARRSDSFLFATDVALLTPDRRHTALFWLSYKSLHGDTLSPSNLALYVRLQNLQSKPSRIAGYSVVFKTGSKSAEAVTLDTRMGQIYFIPNDDLSSASRVAETAGFDVQLANRSYVIQPNESVEGWMLFEYPKEVPFFASAELSVHDTVGNAWSGPVDWSHASQQDTNLLGAEIPLVGSDDLRSFYRKYYDDP